MHDAQSLIIILLSLFAFAMFVRWAVRTEAQASYSKTEEKFDEVKSSIIKVNNDHKKLRNSIHDIRGKLGALSGMQYLNNFEKDNENKDNIN